MGTKNSDLVANFEATPQVLNNTALLHGVVRVAQGTIVVAAGDSDDDDIVMLAPIQVMQPFRKSGSVQIHLGVHVLSMLGFIKVMEQ